MKHNSLSRLLGLFRRLPFRRATANPAADTHFIADFPRLDDLLYANSLTYEPGATDFRSRPEPSRPGRWPAREAETSLSRTTASNAAFVEPSPIVPTECPTCSMGRDAGWPASAFRSRKEARRLRVLDRAIAEIARGRRPR
jgi:hypothetical protein